MSKKLYVGNLPFSLGDAELANLFAQAGNVASARVVLDPATGRKRGFGFVEMSTPEEAEAAVSMFNNSEVEGRQIVKAAVAAADSVAVEAEVEAHVVVRKAAAVVAIVAATDSSARQ